MLKKFLFCVSLTVLVGVSELLIAGRHYGSSCDRIKKSSKAAKSKLSFDLENIIPKAGVVPVLVLGAGPGGLSAGLYGAAQYDTVIISGEQPSLLTETSYVENWLGAPHQLGADLIQNARKQAEGAGARIVEATVEKVDLSAWPFAVNLDDGTTMHALTLIIATGSRPILLGIPGEKKYWANGVSACARCDALFYKGKNVVVIGGGDVAIEEATELARFAKKVTIIHRRGQLRAAGRMQTRLKSYPQINLMYDTTVKEILGDQKKVTGISIVHAGKQETMPIDGVFLAIGHKPNIELFKNILETDDDGCLVLPGGNQQTSVPGVFAAGDVANHYRQAIVAAGRGAEAAIDAIEFLESVGFTLDEAEKLKAAVAAQVQHEKQNTR